MTRLRQQRPYEQRQLRVRPGFWLQHLAPYAVAVSQVVLVDMVTKVQAMVAVSLGVVQVVVVNTVLALPEAASESIG